MAGHTRPEATVVIPTKDRYELLLTALDCALAQEEIEVEIIVVDDGSTDDTAAKLASLKHPAIQVLRSEISRGVASACNHGAAEARGEWIAFLDDDDLWAPRKLRLQLDAARTEGAGWAYCGAVVLDERWSVLAQEAVPPSDDVARILLTYNAIPGGGSNVAVRRDVLRRIGGFDEELRMMQDWDLYIRLALDAPAVALPDVLVAYVEHPGGSHVRQMEERLAKFDYLERKHRDACARHGVKFDRAMFSRHIASGHRRVGNRMAAARSYLRGAVAGRNLGNVVRAGGVLLGDRPMRVGRKLLRRPTMRAPEWLQARRLRQQQASKPWSPPVAAGPR